MKGHFVIQYKATTATGKTFYWYEYVSLGYGDNILREVSNVTRDNDGRPFTIKTDSIYPFKTKSEAIGFAERGDEVADHNGNGFNAFLAETGRKY